MNRRIPLMAVLLVLSASVAATPVAAVEDPRFETYVPEPVVNPGQTEQVTVQFLNDAEEVDDTVETARNVKVTMLEDDTPFTVSSGTHLLGALQDGQPVTDQFVIGVPQDVSSGTYDVPIEVTYEYENDETETTTVHATVRVEDRATFDLESTSSDLSVDSQGTVTVRLENDGSEPASAATVHVQSTTENVRFGQAPSTSSFVGSWAVNETKTLEFDANAPATADPGTYSVDVSVTYEDADAIDRRSVPKTDGIEVRTESDHFSLSNVESDLRVGEDGSVSMTVTNDGDRATDTVIRLGATGMNVHPLETEYAVGTLEAGESTNVTFPIEISASGEATPRQLSFTVEYENGDGDQRRASLSSRVDVAPERDRFVVEPVNTTVQAGSSGIVTFDVTNNGEGPVSNVDAKLFANDPLSAPDDEAYIDRIEPGETERVAFSVGVSGGAQTKSYPVSVDFQYEDDGESELSKSYQLPVDVTPTEGRSVPTIAIVGVVVGLAIVIGGIVWYRRQ